VRISKTVRIKTIRISKTVKIKTIWISKTRRYKIRNKTLLNKSKNSSEQGFLGIAGLKVYCPGADSVLILFICRSAHRAGTLTDAAEDVHPHFLQ
jgi:hypothetical protein